MHEELDGLDLAALVERLDDLEGRRTPIGWTPDDAVIKAALERRVLELVAAAHEESRRLAAPSLPCDLAVNLRTKDESVEARLRAISVGGVLLETDVALPVGTHVHVQISGRSEEHGLHVRGQVAWQQLEPTAGLGVSFSEQPSPAHERRLQRFVREILRHRVEA